MAFDHPGDKELLLSDLAFRKAKLASARSPTEKNMYWDPVQVEVALKAKKFTEKEHLKYKGMVDNIRECTGHTYSELNNYLEIAHNDAR
ncbi:jg16799 [Pararge aegeria aegeria]|uniref:Jg16799 protein n=1 Tax=Pararge aegeria aegeria TaxID=348720 RepID=A0A8S4S0Q4_9NEOP|nr:jg16799 [Pararge aegeria aegeria]